jgi:hypothetical protein
MPLKGMVARDFWPVLFIPGSYPKPFSNSDSDLRRYSNVVPWGLIPQRTQKNLLGRGLFKHRPYMQTIFKKYPFKGTGTPSKLFDMILRGHVQASGVKYPLEQISAGYHTSWHKVLRGNRPL